MDSDLLSPEVHQTQALPKVVVLFIGFSLIVMHCEGDNIILGDLQIKKNTKLQLLSQAHF